MAEHISITHIPMKNVVMKLKPHANYVHVFHQLVGNKIDTTAIEKFDMLSTYLKKETTKFLPPEKDEPDVFCLFIEQIGGFDFIKMGLGSTSEKMGDFPLKAIEIVQINNHVADESYLDGNSNLTTHFMNTHRLS